MLQVKNEFSLLQPFIDELLTIDYLDTNEDKILSDIKPVMSDWCSRTGWLEPRFYQCAPNQERVEQIFECPRSGFTVYVISWGINVKPVIHNHNIWAAVGVVEGREVSTFYSKEKETHNVSDFNLHVTSVKTMVAGDVCCMKRDVIHSVQNATKKDIAISLHIYGKNLNLIERSQFDAQSSTQLPYILDII